MPLPCIAEADIQYPHARCQWPLTVDDQSFRQSKELSGVNAYSRWSTPDLASFIKSDQPRITADSRIRPRLGALSGFIATRFLACDPLSTLLRPASASLAPARRRTEVLPTYSPSRTCTWRMQEQTPD